MRSVRRADSNQAVSPVIATVLLLAITVMLSSMVFVLMQGALTTAEKPAAQATVSVRIEEKGKTTVGQAADTDTLVASANAYLSALNKMIIKREKIAPSLEQNEEKVRGI